MATTKNPKGFFITTILEGLPEDEKCNAGRPWGFQYMKKNM